MPHYEQEIDAYIAKAGEKGLETIKKVGQQGYSFATTTMISSAIKVYSGCVWCNY